MKKLAFLFKISFVVIILIPSILSAQRQQNDIEYICNKIKTNYPGFKIKGNDQTLNSLTDSLIKIYKNDTFRIVSLIVNSFQDQHLRLFIRSKDIPSDSIENTIRFSSMLQYFKRTDSLANFEGFWLEEKNKCVIGIRKIPKSKTDFEAIVVENKSKQLPQGALLGKFERINDSEYLTNFRNPISGNRSFLVSTFRVSGLLITGVEGKWRKLSDYNPDFPILPNLVEKSDTVSTQKLNSKTYLVTVPASTMYNYALLDSFLTRDSAIISQSQNLIIDVRGNLGGKSATLDLLLPWIYTNPIIDVCGDIYSSVDGITQYEKMIESLDSELPLSDEEKEFFANRLKELKNNIGGFVKNEVDTIRFDEVRRNPRNVAVIIDYACQSATEMFLLNAKQSKKVTLWGEHTRGAVDYLDFYPLKSPGNYILFIPLTKRRIEKTGELDGLGIKPDIEISDSEPNWIKYVETNAVEF